MKKKIISILLLVVFVGFFAGCVFKETPPQYNLKLEVWGVIDESDAYDEIFEKYSKISSSVTEITYRKFSTDTYKKELLEALASGKGPDIFMINSTWTPSFLNKIVAAPQEIINERDYRGEFVDMASDNFIKDGMIYAAPLSVDSLALYYNKDLLNEAGVSKPPVNWDEFSDVARKLTKIDSFGNIIQSGAAIGTAYNINRSTDILGLLMLQNGVEMTNEDGTEALFDENKNAGYEGDTRNSNYLGENALNFYTQFAKTSSPNYVWNSGMHYSLDSFAEGNLAMMFNYSWQIKTIESKAPKLNFAIAPVPQNPNNPKVDFGNCWGYVVALNKIPQTEEGADGQPVLISNEIRVAETWKFLKFLTMTPNPVLQAQANGSNSGNVDIAAVPLFDPAKNYLEKTKKPAARKDLINKQIGDYKLGVFAEQNLFTKSWIQLDPDAIEAIMAEMIDQVNKGKFDAQDAIRTAVNRINQIIKK